MALDDPALRGATPLSPVKEAEETAAAGEPHFGPGLCRRRVQVRDVRVHGDRFAHGDTFKNQKKNLGPAPASASVAMDPATSLEASGNDPHDFLWAGFSIPPRFKKFELNAPGREILDIATLSLVKKKAESTVFLVLATDVAFLAKQVGARELAWPAA